TQPISRQFLCGSGRGTKDDTRRSPGGLGDMCPRGAMELVGNLLKQWMGVNATLRGRELFSDEAIELGKPGCKVDETRLLNAGHDLAKSKTPQLFEYTIRHRRKIIKRLLFHLSTDPAPIVI